MPLMFATPQIFHSLYIIIASDDFITSIEMIITYHRIME